MTEFTPPTDFNDLRSEADRLRALLDACWREAKRAYRKAGQPFGATPRGLELWIEYMQQTTVN